MEDRVKLVAAKMEYHTRRLAQLQHEAGLAGGLEGEDRARALEMHRTAASGVMEGTAAILEGHPRVAAKQMTVLMADLGRAGALWRTRGRFPQWAEVGRR